MPADMTKYGPRWKPFSYWVRHTRAQGQCECAGECHLHTMNPLPRRCTELNGKPAHFAHGTVVLTVAHLCNCDPPCTIPGHVKAMCQRCHLRVDRQLHRFNRASTLHAKNQTPFLFAGKNNYTPDRPVHPRRDINRRF